MSTTKPKKEKKAKEVKVVTDDKVMSVEAPPALPVMTVPAFAYRNMFGSFGIIQGTLDADKNRTKISSVTWEGCRDRFQSQTEGNGIRDFLFFFNNGTVDHVIDFVRTVEKVVKLEPKDQVEFHKTNDANCLYVKMSDWWAYRLRRSLLSALLRCGQMYTDRTAAGFDKALYSQYYTSATKPAIEQFLKGRTGSKLKKRTNFSGWYNQFSGKSEKDVLQTLVKVKPRTPEELEAEQTAKAAALAAKKAEAEAKLASEAAEKATVAAAKAAEASEAATKAKDAAAAAAAKMVKE
jgi:hypothetical protein